MNINLAKELICTSKNFIWAKKYKHRREKNNNNKKKNPLTLRTFMLIYVNEQLDWEKKKNLRFSIA